MRRLSRLLPFFALLLGFATPAWADGHQSYRICGGDTFATCAAVEITVVGTDVTVRMWNLSGNPGATYGTDTYAGTIINGIGFYNTGGVTAVTGTLSTSGPVRGNNVPGNWSIGNNSQLGWTMDFRTQSPTSYKYGIGSGCAAPGQLSTKYDLYLNPCKSDLSNPADWVTFTFKISGNWDPSTSDIVIRGVTGPNGATTECYSGLTPSGHVSNCPTVVTPEPVSMTLLASGLVGMGGAGMFRRRRQQQAA